LIKTPVNEYTMNKAGAELGRWMIQRAARLARDVGFSYEPAGDAPETYEAVLAAVRRSQCERVPFPVWAGGSDATIYGSAEANYAFRYWHDMAHIASTGDFTVAGELAAVRMQLTELARTFGTDSIEYALFVADTLGQVWFHERTEGGFVQDQKSWVFAVVQAHADTHRGDLQGLEAHFLEGLRSS